MVYKKSSTLNYSTDLTQCRTRPHSWIWSWPNYHPKKGVAPVLLVDITKHTQGCTLTSETGATPPPLAIIKPRANPRARANATLLVIGTVPRVLTDEAGHPTQRKQVYTD